MWHDSPGSIGGACQPALCDCALHACVFWRVCLCVRGASERVIVRKSACVCGCMHWSVCGFQIAHYTPAYIDVCGCVCVRESTSESESESARQSVCVWAHVFKCVCVVPTAHHVHIDVYVYVCAFVCVWERERVRASKSFVCVRVCLNMWLCLCMCVCVCMRCMNTCIYLSACVFWALAPQKRTYIHMNIRMLRICRYI